MRARILFSGLAALLPLVCSAQFVYPKPEYHAHDPAIYQEDPFIVKYRKEFFSVFRGDFPRFYKAYEDVRAMAEKDPKDARALVWLGNGHTVQAGLLWFEGKQKESIALLEESRKVLDRAVGLRPDDPNIFMMRAVTLYIQGDRWPEEHVPSSVWKTLVEDCEHLIRLMGDKMPKASIHVRGETHGELGIAYKRLGDTAKARKAFEKVIELCPGTEYETRARRELAAL